MRNEFWLKAQKVLNVKCYHYNSIMKRTMTLFVALALSAVAYGQQNFNPTAGSDIVYQVPQYVDPNWYEGANELCPTDQWLRIPDDMKGIPLLENLADAYNALLVFHSVLSDFECYEQFGKSTAQGMKEMNTTVIHDENARQCADIFKDEMAKAQHDENIDVEEVITQYMGKMLSRYNLEKLVENEFIFSDEIYENAIDHDSLSTDAFSHRCVEAIELAHQIVDELPNYEATSKLVDVLTAGQYSPLLPEAWKNWRALISSQMGHSKNSYIPNEEYNRLRMIACYTMLCHIKDYPADWVAVNNFLLMASEQNVAIFGPYSFGNQSILIFYEMFPELKPE